jgi:hypothetical protein
MLHPRKDGIPYTNEIYSYISLWKNLLITNKFDISVDRHFSTEFSCCSKIKPNPKHHKKNK